MARNGPPPIGVQRAPAPPPPPPVPPGVCRIIEGQTKPLRPDQEGSNSSLWWLLLFLL